MKKQFLVSVAAALLLSSSALASYIVVMKDGTRYRAKDRWTIVNGKAMLTLENGSTLSIDPSLIDVAKSNEQNQSGLGDARLIGMSGQKPADKKPELSSLGELTKARKAGGDSATGAPAAGIPLGAASESVVRFFTMAYENVGLYGAKISAQGANGVKVDIVADNEDQVFKALSATAYMINQLPQRNIRVDVVDLTMVTIKSGSAGRFKMTAEDAKALTSRAIPMQQYYVSNVIF